MPENHEDGTVTFSVKELLVDIRQAIDRVGEASKADLLAAENRLSAQILAVETTSKAQILASETRIKALEVKAEDIAVWRARVAGAASVAALVGGGLGTVVGQILG